MSEHAFSASSRIFDLNGEVKRPGRSKTVQTWSAIIGWFLQRINPDEISVHTGGATRCIGPDASECADAPSRPMCRRW